MRMNFGVRAVLLTAATTAALVFGPVVPAFAHVEVSANKAQAGATDVTVTFDAEAERDSAGITKVEVILPAGIAADTVTKVSGPVGWSFGPTNQGVAISGTALATGKNADFALKFAKFPSDTPQLVLKTLVSYSDGSVDRWIEIPVSGQPEPPHPAPVIELTGAVSPAPSTTSAATTPTASPSAASAVDKKDNGSSKTGLWVSIAVIVVGAGVTLYFANPRRRTN